MHHHDPDAGTVIADEHVLAVAGNGAPQCLLPSRRRPAGPKACPTSLYRIEERPRRSGCSTGRTSIRRPHRSTSRGWRASAVAKARQGLLFSSTRHACCERQVCLPSRPGYRVRRCAYSSTRRRLSPGCTRTFLRPSSAISGRKTILRPRCHPSSLAHNGENK